MTETDSGRNVEQPVVTEASSKSNLWASDIAVDNLDVGRNIRDVVVTNELSDLARSIETQGILQPILVQIQPPGTKPLYRVIDGHRRVAAAKQLGMRTVPCIVRDHVQHEIIDAQLTANLHRKDLTPLEEAKAYREWLQVTRRQQQDLARMIAKSPSYVSNRLRLLKLQPGALKALEEGKLSPSAAEILLSVPEDMPEVQAQALRRFIGNDPVVIGGPSRFYDGAEDLVREAVAKRKEEIELDKKRKAMLEEAKKSKYPACPKCGKPPLNRISYPWSLPKGSKHGVECASEHDWDLQLGLMKERAVSIAEQRKRSDEHRGASTREAKEFYAETPVVTSAHTPFDMINALVQKAGDSGILRVAYDSTGEEFGRKISLPPHLRLKDSSGNIAGVARVTVYLSGPVMDGRWFADLVRYSTGHKAQVIAYTSRLKRKKEIKQAFKNWEEASLRRAVPKPGKPFLVDADILRGSVGEISARIGKLGPESLQKVRELEVKGRCRVGVLEVIDARLGTGRSLDYSQRHYGDF
jgi:ParB/RepB/Spo0J family partition protein